MHEKARQRHERELLAARTPKERDAVLDRYCDSLLRATEWDAQQWGFDPDRWFERERVQLAERGGSFWPVEIVP